MSKTDAWRDKTRVLCLFRYWARVSGSTVIIDDAIMVEVEFKDQIELAFQAALGRQKRYGWPVGPEPQRWEMTGYIPQYPFVDKDDMH